MNKRVHNKSEGLIWKVFNIFPLICMLLCGVNIYINHYKKCVDVETNTIISSEFEDYDKIIQEENKVNNMVYIRNKYFASYEDLSNVYFSLLMNGSNDYYVFEEPAFRIYSEDSDHQDYVFTAYYSYLSGNTYSLYLECYSYDYLVAEDFWLEDYPVYIYERYLSNGYSYLDLYAPITDVIEYIVDFDSSKFSYLLDNDYRFEMISGDLFYLDEDYIVTEEISFNYANYSLPQQLIDTSQKYVFKGFDQAFNGKLYLPFDGFMNALSISNNNIYSCLKLLYSFCMWFLLVDLIQLLYYILAWLPKKFIDAIQR